MTYRELKQESWWRIRVDSRWMVRSHWRKTPFGGWFNKRRRWVVADPHSVWLCPDGRINIGCQRHTYAWWRKHGVKLARRAGFTKEQIKAYRYYVNLVRKS